MLEAKNCLYTHFLSKTVFSLRDDLRALQLGRDYDAVQGKLAPYKAALVRGALEEMVKLGFLLALDQEQGVYVLTQPMGTFTQTVAISPYTASVVADVFNFFARQSGGKVGYVANKLSITDTEIQTAALMCFSLRDQIDDMMDMDDDDGPEGDAGVPDLGGAGPYGMN